MSKKERFVNLRFFTFALLSVIVGIFAGYVVYFKSTLYSAIFLIVVGTAYFIILFLLKRYSKRIGYIIFMVIALILFLTTFSSSFYKIKSFTSETITEGEYTIQGTVKEIRESDETIRVVLKDLVFVCDKDFTSDYCLQATLSSDYVLSLGNRISFTADIYHNTVVYENEPRMDVINDQIRYTASNVDEDSFVLLDDSVTIFGKVYNKLTETLRQGLDGDRYGVALAMLTGNSQDISGTLLDSFRFAGVAHIFAVSGLHIGVFAGALGMLAKIFPKAKRKYFSPIIVAVLTFYSGVCGFSSSSIRAVVMYSVLAISILVDERYDGISSLSLAAFFTLLFMPFEIFQAGFLLSYSASGFIVALINIFMAKFSFMPKWLASSLAVGISAFLAGLPISLKFFGYISPIALLLNVIFLPLVSFLFVLLIASVFIAIIIGHANVLLIPSNYILIYINKAFNFFNFEDWVISFSSMGVFTVFYYIAMLCMAGLFNIKKRLNTLIICLCFLLSLGGTVYRNNVSLNSVYVTTTSSYETNATLMYSKGDSVLIISDIEYFSTKGISRAVNKSLLTEIDALVVAEKDVDIIELSMKIQNLIDVKKIYCYDVADKFEIAYGVPVEYLSNYEKVSVGDIDFRFIADGFTVESFCQKTHVVAHSKVKESSVGYYLANGNPSLIVVANNVSSFEDMYNRKVENYLNSNTHTVGNDYYKFNTDGKLI